MCVKLTPVNIWYYGLKVGVYGNSLSTGCVLLRFKAVGIWYQALKVWYQCMKTLCVYYGLKAENDIMV